MAYRDAVLMVARTAGLFSLLCLQSLALPQWTRGQTFPNLTTALDAIGTRYKIHLGLESVSDDQDLPITLDLSSGDVGTILNSLVAQRSRYVWALRDGTYDIYPKSNPHSILDVKIRSFSLNKVSYETASREMSELPELKEWLSKQGVIRRELQVGSIDANTKLQISLTVSAVSLRTVLNLINQETSHPYWVVSRYGDRKQYVGIYP
jgi:hypothetical protein